MYVLSHISNKQPHVGPQSELADIEGLRTNQPTQHTPQFKKKKTKEEEEGGGVSTTDTKPEPSLTTLAIRSSAVAGVIRGMNERLLAVNAAIINFAC